VAGVNPQDFLELLDCEPRAVGAQARGILKRMRQRAERVGRHIPHSTGLLPAWLISLLFAGECNQAVPVAGVTIEGLPGFPCAIRATSFEDLMTPAGVSRRSA
jgi:hypothetical protein